MSSRDVINKGNLNNAHELYVSGRVISYLENRWPWV